MDTEDESELLHHSSEDEKMKRWNCVFLIVTCVALCCLTACSKAIEREPLDSEIVLPLAQFCLSIAQGQIDAWNSRDPENLRAIYTEDIVHFDGQPAYEGIDEVINMLNGVFKRFKTWQVELGETYISGDECFVTVINFDIFDLTKDNPGLEFDVLETRDGKISFWRLFYDQSFNEILKDEDQINHEFISSFATV